MFGGQNPPKTKILGVGIGILSSNAIAMKF